MSAASRKGLRQHPSDPIVFALPGSSKGGRVEVPPNVHYILFIGLEVSVEVSKVRPIEASENNNARQQRKGCGPLHDAARGGNTEKVVLLLKTKANVAKQTASGETALFLAASKQLTERIY